MRTLITDDAGAEVPVLDETAMMDLPAGATQNADGSVHLELDYPFDLIFRPPGGEPRTEHFDHLVLRRLNGAEVEKMLGAKDTNGMALAIASGVTPAKLALMTQKLDAADFRRAQAVVKALLGGDEADDGLPPNAARTPDGVVLTLRAPAPVADVGAITELTFKRMTAAQLRQAYEAPALLTWAVSYSTGLTPKQAKEALVAMDGADARAVNLVVLFLFGSGRTTGG